MKNRILSFILALTLVFSTLAGTAIISGAEGDEQTVTYIGTALNLAENITVRVEFEISEALIDGGAYAVLSIPNGKKEQIAVTQKAIDYYNGTTCIFEAEVAVKDFARDVTVEIYDGNDSKLTIIDTDNSKIESKTVSASAYCESYKTTDPEGVFIDLIAALEAYGAAADNYFSKASVKLDNIDSFLAALESMPDPVKEGTLPEGIKHRSASLLLESEMTVRHYFQLSDPENTYIQNYIFFVDLDNDEECDPAEKITPVANASLDGLYSVDITGITPNEIDNIYKICVIGKADNSFYSFEYGPMTYLKRIYKEGLANNSKNLFAAIYDYNATASKLKGTVTFNANGGSKVDKMTYEYGVDTPIVAVSTLGNNTFLGWFDENGVKYDTIPASQTGDLELTAKWVTGTLFSNYTKINDLMTLNLIECTDHRDTDGDMICDNEDCGYCTAENAANCVFYKGSGNVSDTSLLVCTNCGKKLTTGNYNKVFGFSHNRFAFAKNITLSNGLNANLFAVSGDAQILKNDLPSGSSLYNILFDSDGNLLGNVANNTVYVEMNVGRPTSAQIDNALAGTNFIQVNDDAAKFYPEDDTTLSFRIGHDLSHYSSALFEISGANITVGKTVKTVISNVIPTDGTVKKFTFALDFSAAKKDDSADTITVSVYDENGNLLGSGKGTTLSDKDISAYNNQMLGQLRLLTSGSVLFSDYRVYVKPNTLIAYPDDVTLPQDAPKTHEYGKTTKLPTPTKDGYVFAGWYLDEALTEAVSEIPANKSGSVDLYAKWNKIYCDEDFEDAKIQSNVTIPDSNNRVIGEDGRLYWTAQKTYTYMRISDNSIKNSTTNSFSTLLTIAKLKEEDAMNARIAITATSDGTEGGSDRTSLPLMNITGNNVCNSDGNVLFPLTDEMVTVVVTVDFEKELIYIYDENGVLLDVSDIKIPSAFAAYASNAMEFKSKLRDKYNVRLDNLTTPGTLVVDHFTVTEGYYFGEATESYRNNHTEEVAKHKWIEDGELKILMMGNSFTQDASNVSQPDGQSQMFSILRSMLGDDVKITLGIIISGAKGLSWHATKAEEGSISYTLQVISSDNPEWVNVKKVSSAEALDWADWDIVSLQPYRVNPTTGQGYIKYPEETDEKFYNIADSSAYLLDHVYKYAPQADVYCYMHWSIIRSVGLNANLSGYNQMAAFYPTMFNYKGTESGNEFKGIVPVGLAVQNARSTYLSLLSYNPTAYDENNLNYTTDAQIGLQRDEVHMTYNIGRYIAALTFAEFLIPESMRVEGYELPDIRETESIGVLPKEYTTIAQKAVFAAVNAWKNGSLEVTNIVGYEKDPTTVFAEKFEGVYTLNCEANTSAIETEINKLISDKTVDDLVIEKLEIPSNVTANEAFDVTVTVRFGYTTLNFEISAKVQ